MFIIDSISGKPVLGGKCQGAISPDEHGNFVIHGSYTGNIDNFWMVFRMGETVHRCSCALGQYKDGPDAVHEVSFLAPRNGRKYEPYHGRGSLELYMHNESAYKLDPDALPDLLVDIEEIVVE